jgi:hypothetical protein
VGAAVAVAAGVVVAEGPEVAAEAEAAVAVEAEGPEVAAEAEVAAASMESCSR